MNKKLKIYSILLAIVLVGTVFSNTFDYDNYSTVKREGEVLTLDSLTEEFAKIDWKTTVKVDTVDGKRDTIATTSWNVQFKPTLEVTVPVRPCRAAIDKFLYSKVDGQSCMVAMQKVKLKVPMEKGSDTFTIVLALTICLLLPPSLWLLIIILKVIRSVYKGEIFVTQISKRLETAGWLLVAIWFLGNVVGYIQIQLLRDAVLMAYYDIYWQLADVSYIVFGLVLMILSQIILKGKDLKDEQELTI